MATWYAQASTASFFSVSGGTTSNQWNSAANGSGSWLDLSTNFSADTFSANGKTTIGLDANVTAATLTSAGGAGTWLINTTGVTITANLAAGTADGSFVMSSAVTVNIVGNITGGVSSSDYCISITAGGTLNVTGNVTGGSHASGYAIYNGSAACTINITGNVTASTAPAIHSNTDGTVVTVTSGNIVDTATISAIQRAKSLIYSPGAANYYRMKTGGAATIDLYYDVPAVGNVTEDDTVGGATGAYHEATEAEVQSGVHFGAGSALTGSYAGGGGGIWMPRARTVGV